MADMAKMDDWLGEIPSPSTRKNYRNGIKKFEEWEEKQGLKPVDPSLTQNL
jgi:uncharacterized protein YeaO (DUF488 family)